LRSTDPGRHAPPGPVPAPRFETRAIYFVHIVERAAMVQVITADAMGASIDKDGFVALDIHFATGKGDILPESMPIVDEIVTLLQRRRDLRVGVDGHTDNTGTPAGNQALSEARAKRLPRRSPPEASTRDA
jgi:outer membrane protein OmpA-like peptidoglycan-associated protein